MTLVLLLLLAPNDVYEQAGEIGPQTVSFPWSAAFSPDGKWVAFADGHTPYCCIYSMATRKQAWRSDHTKFTHRPVFAPDSKRMITVVGGDLVVVRLEEGAWRKSERIPLRLTHLINAQRSPLPLALSPRGNVAALVNNDRAYVVDLVRGEHREVAGVRHALFLPDGTLALAGAKTFRTRLLGRGEIEGVLLAASPDGKLWLVAPDEQRFDSGFRTANRLDQLALQIRDAGTNKALSDFVLSAKLEKKHGSPHRLLIQAIFSPDSLHLLTVESVGGIVIRAARTGTPVQVIDAYKKANYSMGVAISRDGAWLVTGGRRDGHDILLWRR